MNKIRLIARAAVGVVYLALAVFAFLGGRGHKLYVNNYTAGPGSGAAVKVEIKGAKPLDVKPNGIRFVTVIGQRQQVTFSFADGASVSREVRIPVGTDAVMIHAAAVKSGAEAGVIPVDPNTEER